MKCPITKIDNPLRNILAPAIIYVIVANIAAMLTYGLFDQIWLPFASVWRPMEEACYWQIGMNAANLLTGLIISIIFVKLQCLSKNPVKICSFALILFILTRFIGEIYNYVMFPYDFSVALLGLAHGALTLLLWALISNKIFKFKT